MALDIERLITESVVKGKVGEVESLTKEAVKQGLNAPTILHEAFIPGLDILGSNFSEGKMFLPEMLVAAMAVKSGMEIVKPRLLRAGVKSKGKVVIGTVYGDIHDIGKNIVCMMLDGSGFEVIDLGVDVSVERFVDSARKSKANIVAMSALLSTTRKNMVEVIKAIEASEAANSIKIMVGGAPVTQEFADSIGADGYAPDAGPAVKKSQHLMRVS